MYEPTKAARLIQISALLTAGELALTVFCSPCTIHGWRPLSVSNQPPVFIRNGVTTAHTDIHRNTRDLRSVPRDNSQPPHSPRSRTKVPRPAMTRIDQYWMNTSGT